MHLAKVLIFVAFAALVPAAAGVSADAKPWLRATRAAPLVLKGGAFVPGERVQMTLRVGKARFLRTVTADASGAFTAGFGLAVVDPCRGMVVVTASGSRGSTSTYKRPCRPASTTPPKLSS